LDFFPLGNFPQFFHGLENRIVDDIPLDAQLPGDFLRGLSVEFDVFKNPDCAWRDLRAESSVPRSALRKASSSALEFFAFAQSLSIFSSISESIGVVFAAFRIWARIKSTTLRWQSVVSKLRNRPLAGSNDSCPLKIDSKTEIATS